VNIRYNEYPHDSAFNSSDSCEKDVL
jgi:hypothetical protein